MIKDNKWGKWVPMFVFGLLLIVAYKTLDNISELFTALGNFIRIIAPFLFSILIVYVLYIPCTKLEAFYKESKYKFVREKARGLSVFSVYTVLVCLLTIIIAFVIPVLINSLVDLARNIPGYYNYVLGYINNLSEDSIWGSLNLKDNLIEFANNILVKLFNPAQVEQLAKSIISLANSVLNTFVSLIISLYILLDRENIFAFFNKLSGALFKSNTESQFKKYLTQVNKVVFAFVASKGLDSIINLVAITTILTILNAKYALLLGLIAAILSFIPYLGSLIGVVFITFITLITGGTALAIPTLVLLIIFQQIDGNFLEPKIMGTNLKISPILVIFAVIVGGAYFGMVGMLLGVPIATVLKQLLSEYIDSKKVKNT